MVQNWCKARDGGWVERTGNALGMRLWVYLSCTACGSQILRTQRKVRNYRIGHQGVTLYRLTRRDKDSRQCRIVVNGYSRSYGLTAKPSVESCRRRQYASALVAVGVGIVFRRD